MKLLAIMVSVINIILIEYLQNQLKLLQENIEEEDKNKIIFHYLICYNTHTNGFLGGHHGKDITFKQI